MLPVVVAEADARLLRVELARAAVLGQQSWQAARAADDFAGDMWIEIAYRIPGFAGAVAGEWTFTLDGAKFDVSGLVLPPVEGEDKSAVLETRCTSLAPS